VDRFTTFVATALIVKLGNGVEQQDVESQECLNLRMAIRLSLGPGSTGFFGLICQPFGVFLTKFLA
jgi:hypothetical protein